MPQVEHDRLTGGVPPLVRRRHRAIRLVHVLTVGRQRRVLRKWSAKSERTCLRQHRIGIDEHASPALLELVDPVDVAQIEVDIAVAADRRQLAA
jgi:hypothetical protein